MENFYFIRMNFIILSMVLHAHKSPSCTCFISTIIAYIRLHAYNIYVSMCMFTILDILVAFERKKEGIF